MKKKEALKFLLECRILEILNDYNDIDVKLDSILEEQLYSILIECVNKIEQSVEQHNERNK